MIHFFSKEEEEAIISSIRKAELDTSGEIRVHLEDKLKGPVIDLAVRVFKRLGMHKTKARNGVLILIAPNDRQFAIIGDKGIDGVVPENFWDEEKSLMQEHFKRGAFCDGVCAVISRIGEKLKSNFPYQDDDENELPDEISYSS
ncbi:MAG: TPM domain-containing protein [Saprospiraceae bacterium]|nr:TPM domain-containing protein [Saprospiraceae bacterium]MCB9326151.1 TPM domain-containing protein [Lewinellaceae bacterium]